MGEQIKKNKPTHQTSEHITTNGVETALSSPDNTSDSILDTFNEIYGSSPEGSSSTSSVGNDEDVNIENNTSPNQDDGGLLDIGTHQSRPSSDITDLLGDGPSSEHITSNEHITPDAAQIRNSNHTFQEGTPVLTVEVFNDIVQGGRNKSPILVDDSDQEFFKIKEQRFAQHMQRFDNGSGTYTISHPIAMAVVLALDTKQRSEQELHACAERKSNNPHQTDQRDDKLCQAHHRRGQYKHITTHHSEIEFPG